jgi:regulatory protein
LTLECTVKNRLKVGQTVSAEFLSQIQLESEKDTAFDKALTHLSATQKTEKQIRDFLSGKGYLPAVADFVVEKMRGYNFLNDGEYAERYVEFTGKKKGARLIRMELKSKGVSDDEIDGALDGLDEDTQVQTAKSLLQKYMRGKTEDRETLQKAFRYLLSKGFEFEVAKSALSSLGDIDED